MKPALEKLKSLYIEPELQFRFVAMLLALVTVEGIFVGLGFLKLTSLAKDWQRASLVWDFFRTLLALLIPMVAVNVAVGLLWSVRLARPLRDLKRGLKNLRDGLLSARIEPRHQDALKDVVRSFNETASKMEKVIERDRALVTEALQILKIGETADKKNFKKILLAARSKLVVINSHFKKNMPGADGL
jgi:methyl-accepting chemotaxis protein